MKDNKSKKEICALYKEREIIGGVYVIRNTLSNKLLLKAETDLRRSKNRFDFHKQPVLVLTLSCKATGTNKAACSLFLKY